MKNRLFALIVSLFALALLACAPARAQIVNQASVDYAGADGKPATLASNRVEVELMETIRYFTDSSYRTLATVTDVGRELYIEASSPACNADPARADRIVIAIASRKTGDVESYLADETAPNSATFHITQEITASQYQAGAPATSMPGMSEPGQPAMTEATPDVEFDGAIEAGANDYLTATIASCGSRTASTSILIDPIGVVFDSSSGQPLAGASVTLLDVNGAGNGGNPGGPAIVYDTDGATLLPSTVVTGTDGMYHFPLVAASLYRLQVTPPSNYDFPSKKEPGTLAAGRLIALYGSFGGDFPVNESTGAVMIDVPLDPIPGALYLEKTASRARAEIADVVDYTIRIHNTAEQQLVGVKVDDSLPAGFSLEPGSVRLGGAAAADPAGGRGPSLQFDIGTIAPGKHAVLRYRLRVGAGALQGDGINRARATSAAPLALTSVVAAAKVKVEAGVFSEKGVILGKVFADCNADGIQGAGEPGIPGVRLYLEDGSHASTDIDGKYSFAETRPRTHVVKLDRSTLPPGASLMLLANRNGGDGGSRFVDQKAGELARADFASAGCGDDMLAAIEARRTALSAEQAARAVTLGAAPAALPATAPAPARAAAAAGLATLDNSLGFVGLQDGAVLAGTRTTVRVKGTAGSLLRLLVNGVAVPDTQVGQRSSVAARQLESWEFVGVALAPGRNELEVQQRDSFGNARGSSKIGVVVPGAAARIVLQPGQRSVAADGRSLVLVRVALEDSAGVTVAERTPLTLDAARGQWQGADLDPREPGLQVFVEGGSAELALRAPHEAGPAELKAGSGALRAEASLDFVPALRPLVAAGVVEGSFSLADIRGNTTRPKRSFDGFEDSLRHYSASLGRQEAELGARAAMFVKGTVATDTLLTMSYDSEKVEEEKLFRDLDPTGFYPALGDSAERGVDARSTGRLYLRAERQKSSVMYGDFTTPGMTAARSLGAYNRSLTGLRQHVEAGGLTLDAFASRDSTRQMVVELPGNGTSGPYLTGAAGMVINSERVELVVRDRNQPSLVRSARQQARYADYDVEPLTGRILMRAPVPSLDADLNPVSVRISYEVDQGAPRFWVGGLAAQYKLGDKIELGASYVNDRNPLLESQLASVNASVKPDQKTVVTVEAARIEQISGNGNAGRVEAVRKDGKLEARVFAVRTGAGFANPSALLPQGRAEAGLRASYQLDTRWRLDAELLHTADIASGAAREGGQLGAGYAFGNGLRIEGGVRHSREQGADGVTLADPDLTSVRAKLSAQVPGLPQAGVSLEAEQDVKDSGRRMVAVGGDYRFAGGSRLYGRHELISSLGSNYALNEGQQRNATVFGIDSDYMQDGRVFSEYRARGGAFGADEAEAAIGLRNLWRIADGVRANTSFERIRVLSGPAANESVAAAAAIDYARNPLWRANARLEGRHGDDSDSALGTLGLAYKLSDSWTFLGKNTLAANRSRGNDSTRINQLLQSGFAYRAPGTLGWNALAKYEFRHEQDDGLADQKRAVHAVSVTGNWQPRADTVLLGRYAAKQARDRSSGLDTRSSAQLLSARVTHDIARDWDIGVAAQMLFNGQGGGRQYAAGLEAGYQLRQNMWVSAGYNLLGFRERDLAGADATAKGAYLRLRMKFDERTIDGVLNAFN